MTAVIIPLLVFGVFARVAIAQPVQICDDSREWPPYSYFARGSDRVDTTRLEGAMIDLIHNIFELIPLQYVITAIPWKRCLYEVANFARGQTYEMAIEGTLNEERLRDYYVTTYVYTTTGGYWYSKKTYPDGPVINRPDDLKNYRLCGIRGHNYAGYGIPPELISSTPSDYQAAFSMVSLQRCDLFLSNLATAQGKARLGELVIPPDIVGKKMPHLKPGTFHIFIAKTSPRAQYLLSEINQAIHILTFRGITDQIFDRYLPACGRHC